MQNRHANVHRRPPEADGRHRPPGGAGRRRHPYYSALVQAERLAAIGQTIATLSHHIKNILQGIRGGSYLIEVGLKDHDETEVVGKGWKIVEKNQNKISDLVMDMLTFSKEREPEGVRGRI